MDDELMRYLITGGCGFLGSNLAEKVLQQRDELCVIDNLSRVGGESNLSWLQSLGPMKFIRCDTRDATAVADVAADFKPDVIFHLAGQVAMTTSMADPRTDFEINTLGTINVLEAARAHTPGAAIIYSSTNKVYGGLESVRYEEMQTRYVTPDFPNGFGEDMPLDFHSPYGCSKGAADQYMLDYARVYGMNTVVFRHSSIFGTRQFSTFDQGWIGWFCQQALKRKKNPNSDPFTIAGNGKQVRDVLFGVDATACYFAACRRIDQVRGQAFNIGGGIANSLSLLELFQLLEEVLDVSLQFTPLPPRFSDQKVFVANLQKVHQSLGWKPSLSSRESIVAMLGWLQ